MKEKTDLIYDTHEKPTIGKWIILALQHVFAMFGATILVPLLVNQATGAEVLTIPVALAMSGIGTLIYILCTKGKSPVYLGSSFAYITPIAVDPPSLEKLTIIPIKATNIVIPTIQRIAFSPLDSIFSRDHVTTCFTDSTWVTSAPAAAASNVAPPV